MTVLVRRDSKGRFLGWPGGIPPPEICQKISNTLLNHEVTEETRGKIRKTLKEKGFTPPKEYWFKKGNKPWNDGVKGIHLSPATEFKKGVLAPNWNGFKKGHQSNLGKKLPPLSEEHKQKISIGVTGEKNGNYKGGITPENNKIRRSAESRLWKEECLTRDNYTCQKYGTNNKLGVHHILNFAEYPELRFDVNNGITLSKKAHKEFHRIYGRKNNTREQIEEFIMCK